MKKILFLIILSSLILGCRSKQKIISSNKEVRKENVSVKVDSTALKELKAISLNSRELKIQEKKNEISYDILIKGKSDPENPFVFHNVVGSDTLQVISISGNADYTIKNHYAKSDNKKAESQNSTSTNIIQDLAQKAVSKETIKDVASAVTNETKKIKSNGIQAGAWIWLGVVGIVALLIFFIYKYIKK